MTVGGGKFLWRQGSRRPDTTRLPSGEGHRESALTGGSVVRHAQKPGNTGFLGNMMAVLHLLDLVRDHTAAFSGSWAPPSDRSLPKGHSNGKTAA